MASHILPAMNTSDLRVVDFADPRSFLDAMESWDHSFMNFCLGTVHLYGRTADAQKEAPNVPLHLHALYRGEKLLIAMTRTPNGFAWTMGVPSTAVDAFEREPGLLASATALLAETLLATLPDPLDLNKIIGPKDAVDSLYSTYCSLLSQRGISVTMDYGQFNVNDCYMTRASLPPLTAPGGSPCTVIPATTDDTEAVALLYIGFQLDTPWKAVVSLEQALAVVTQPVADGLVWVCRIDGAAVGYVMLGRVTARTIAVRNVYVAKEHRRKGIAEEMMTTVTRYCLGVPVASLEGVPDGPPPYGWKEQVSLNVEDLGAARIYKRVGFLLPDLEGGVPTGGLDPVTGRRGWIPSVCWGIQAETTAVSD